MAWSDNGHLLSPNPTAKSVREEHQCVRHKAGGQGQKPLLLVNYGLPGECNWMLFMY